MFKESRKIIESFLKLQARECFIEEKNKFSEFAGIWKNRNIMQESIREQAWR